MDNLPQIGDLVKKSDKALYDRFDLVFSRLDKSEAALTQLASLFASALASLDNKVTTLQEQNDTATNDLKDRIGESRYNEIVQLFADRMGSLTELVSSNRGEISNRLQDLEDAVTVLQTKKDTQTLTALTKVQDALQAISANVRGISQSNDTRASTIENKLADTQKAIDALTEREQPSTQDVPDYRDDFVIIQQRLSSLDNKLVTTQNTSEDFNTKIDTIVDALKAHIDQRFSEVRDAFFAPKPDVEAAFSAERQNLEGTIQALHTQIDELTKKLEAEVASQQIETARIVVGEENRVQ